MTHVSGRNGAVYSGAKIVDLCDIIWTAVGNGAASLQTTSPPEGTGFARYIANTDGPTTVLFKREPGGTIDLADYDGLYWWARTNAAAGTVVTDLELWLYEAGNAANADLKLVQPALTVNVWHQCFDLFEGATSLRDQIIGAELYSVADLGDDEFDLDALVALAEQDGIKTWTLEYTVTTLDVTDFEDVGESEFLPGISSWSGSFEGLKDGIPISIGSEVYLVLGETNTDGNWWLGKAIITSSRPVTDYDGIVSYAYDFQGTGPLEAPAT